MGSCPFPIPVEPRRCSSGASVDPTDARCAKWLRAAELGSTIARRTGLRRAGHLPRYARPSSSLTPGFAGPSTERSTPRDSARPPANPNSLGFLTDTVRRPWLAGGGPGAIGLPIGNAPSPTVRSRCATTRMADKKGHRCVRQFLEPRCHCPSPGFSRNPVGRRARNPPEGWTVSGFFIQREICCLTWGNES